MSDHTDFQLEEIIANLPARQKRILETRILSDPLKKFYESHSRWMITMVSNILENFQKKELIFFAIINIF